MNQRSYVTKTLEYSDLFEDQPKAPQHYLMGLNKRWLIESVVHMISVDRFDSFSMKAEQGLLVMFQDYIDRLEVDRLFGKLHILENQYRGVWLTLINHRAQYSLLRRILLMTYEKGGKGECFESYEALLKATLAENGLEMCREREVLGKIDAKAPDIRDALIIMQQDILNLDQFGDNKKELEKTQIFKYL